MANGIRYTVTTQWGTFSLNEGAYQDYLAGRSWICWNPAGRENQVNRVEPRNMPIVGVSMEAMKLRDRAVQVGLAAALKEYDPSRQIRVPFRDYMKEISVQELNVSVRSSNGLMRAGATTFGKLMELIQSEHGLYGVRNLGTKSVKKITHAFLCEAYHRLSSGEQALYWQQIIENSP